MANAASYSRETRLSYAVSKDATKLTEFIRGLGVRVQVYDIYYAKNRHWVWFVPGEDSSDLKKCRF